MVINVITLGCSKNLVDSEHLLYQFKANGIDVMHNEPDKPADIVIINTCGFILDAKEESVDTILHFIERKKKGFLKRLYVMGCLSERYDNDLRKELPIVDGFYGVRDWEKIMGDIDLRYDSNLANNRFITTPDHYAFLKISEGCNRKCSFCAIPLIRGRQKSVSVDDLAEEAENLVAMGTRELILIAQDLTNYGVDRYGKPKLPELLERLLDIKELDWIRLHYAYPTGFPDEIMCMMASEERICNYLDIPVQHVNDRILKEMGRGHSRSKLEKLLHSFRSQIPDVALRTTILAGFPGETGQDHQESIELIKKTQPDTVNVSKYSARKGTIAAKMKQVDRHVINARSIDMSFLCNDIAKKRNEMYLGKEVEFTVLEKMKGYVGRNKYYKQVVVEKSEIKKREKVKISSYGTSFIKGEIIRL